ncbi:hypothetical protein [Pseudomonas aylmerensis]|uniref:Tail fiber protein n=1 Tax=Pseudomonas aylmerensis TaxID=1869229 RepID=A0ABX2YX64_9PSED|nr:hypothetical protein [Pseudomonas aylmerensis]OCW28137.1 hypothetical protein BBG20_12565 [Pseudomonas aylmerensis]
MSIIPLNIGSAPNDGSGQDLRSGGQVINANFSELDQRTSAAQSAAQGAQATADAAIPGTQKGQPNGVAALDGNGTVPASQLPSYVDDVLEFNSFGTLPVTGETGKIYITIDTNNQYRWSGTQYVLLTASPGSTDSVPEGAVNKYWTLARTLGSVLTGLVTTNPAVIVATDTVIAAFGKLQKQITDLSSAVTSKATKGSNGDITEITGLTTPLSVSQGGTGSASGVPEMAGASAGAAGTKGLVPAPPAGATRFLSSLGTWLSINASASWGAITGTLSDQADLKTALDSKMTGSPQQLCTAWVNFDGTTGAIKGSYNVASVTRSAVGTYRINFITPMMNINYVPVCLSNVLTATDQGNQAYPVGLNLAYVDVVNRVSGAFIDRPFYGVSITGGR